MTKESIILTPVLVDMKAVVVFHQQKGSILIKFKSHKSATVYM